MRSPFRKTDPSRSRSATPRQLNREERLRSERELSSSELKSLEDDDLAELLAATNAKRRARGKEDLNPDHLVEEMVEEERAKRPPKGSPNRWDALD